MILICNETKVDIWESYQLVTNGTVESKMSSLHEATALVQAFLLHYTINNYS